MYYLTVGYPLGMDIIDNRLVFQVSLNSRNYSLIPVEQRIWHAYLLGAYEDEVVKALSPNDRQGYESTINKFIQTGLIQGLKEPGFVGLEPLVFLRQGVGIGLNLEKQMYMVLFRQELALSKQEYQVWMLADGHRSFRKIEEQLPEIGKSQVREIIIRLCRRGLILAVNREER